MVTGIRVEIPGEEVREALDSRIAAMREQAERYRYEAARPAESQKISDLVLPKHICINEERMAMWKAEVLEEIRERINLSEVYLLNRRELDFLGLLPSKPCLIDPYDLDEETYDGFTVERIDTGLEGLDITCIRNTGAGEKS